MDKLNLRPDQHCGFSQLRSNSDVESSCILQLTISMRHFNKLSDNNIPFNEVKDLYHDPTNIIFATQLWLIFIKTLACYYAK